MPRRSTARSGSIAATQPEPEPEQAPPYSRHTSQRPEHSTTAPEEHGRPKEQAQPQPASIRHRQQEHKSQRHQAGRDVQRLQSGAAPSPSPGNGQHPSQRKKEKSPHPLKGGQTRQQRSTQPDLRRTAQTSRER